MPANAKKRELRVDLLDTPSFKKWERLRRVTQYQGNSKSQRPREKNYFKEQGISKCQAMVKKENLGKW